jgi:hypothetical protein
LLTAKASQVLLTTSLARQPSSVVAAVLVYVITFPPVATKVEGYVSENQHFNNYFERIPKGKIQKE